MDILFFAKLRETVGLSQCTVSLAELNLSAVCSVSQLIEGLCSNQHLAVFNGANISTLKDQMAENLLASVDQVLVDDFNIAIINDDNEIAFFPPVTGG